MGEPVKAGSTVLLSYGGEIIETIGDFMMSERKLKAFWQPG